MPVLERADRHRISFKMDRLNRTRLSYELFEKAWKQLPSALFQPGQGLRVSHNMGRIVGEAIVIKAPHIQPNQKATFARRKLTYHGRPSRVSEIDGPAPPTHYITIIGDWDAVNEWWTIRTAYPGQYVAPQPWDFAAVIRSGLPLEKVLEYWCNAAFLYRPAEFETASHDDTWAGLIEEAARHHPAALVERVGYEAVRRLWAT